ncbi:PHB depolymerase family esterase [Achromobacter sp. GG226]|uniref:extracellular catalytic domain type 1 short-chain-length polyhydroxyalkanoate depolymerase n=1 Tax=Verticiella alkaliphila TaxID=2779529 RepID=UPI001C0BA511|nr:PHB depolymerase family esterase [Verticiella sp. GG226]MBU4612303.1 PHB depolymerase family esterase [Verticiella sp. GG226]
MRRAPFKPLLQQAVRLARRQQKAWLAVTTANVAAGKKAVKRAATSADERSRKAAAARQANPRPPLGTARLGPGRWEPSQLRESGNRLDAFRYLPASAPTPGLPLVVMLHGCRQTATDFALGTRMNAVAEERGFAVLYPQQAVSRQAQRCWRWFEPDARHGLAEADLIAAMVRREVARLALDSTRVYVAGLSAGAGMAALLALRHPDLFAAVALHSGPVLGAAQSALGGIRTMRRGAGVSLPVIDAAMAAPLALRDGVPALVLHGTDDKAVDVRNAAGLARQFAMLNGFGEVDADVRVVGAGTRREYQRHDYAVGKRLGLRVCLIPGLGHAWSGGDDAIAFHAAHGPQASRLAWQFFRGRRRLAAPAQLAD